MGKLGIRPLTDILFNWDPGFPILFLGLLKSDLFASRTDRQQSFQLLDPGHGGLQFVNPADDFPPQMDVELL